MKGIFCVTKAKNNEEYRKELKTKNLVLGILMICSLVAAGIVLWAKRQGISKLSDYIAGVYCGAGTGIAIGCLINLIKNLIRMKDEEKLKKSRLENTDERILEIRDKAQRMAMLVLLLTIFAGGMIGGIFYPILIRTVLVLIYVFLFAYVIAYWVYQKKM